ncbi:MAG: formylglycine-generating enzyme family protein [Ktedonobacterales bacterium]|nr:formylglycine-generating enzyme family protein [Ktedonobacterales bacterium]
MFPPELAHLGFSSSTRRGIRYILPPSLPISSGTFLMGSDASTDPDARSDESPPHQVTLPTYYLGVYPVTVAEYACALASHPHWPPPVNWRSQSSHPTHPVSALTWVEAWRYTRWLTTISQHAWRLPNEAEWEKAARGNDGRIYPWGNRFDAYRANCFSQGETRATMTPVNQYPAGRSPYGMLDMCGNVSEWLSTIWNKKHFRYPYESTDGREILNTHASFRCMRGGCYLFPPSLVRTTARHSFDITDRFDWLHGLRLASSSPPSRCSRDETASVANERLGGSSHGQGQAY